MYNTTISSATNDKPSSAEEWAAFWCNRIERHWPVLLPNLAKKLQKIILTFLCQHKCNPTDIKTDELCNFLKNNKQYSENECNFIKTAFLILFHTHVSNKDLTKIKNPLDRLMRPES